MANIQRRGKYWRVQIRRKGYPAQTRSFDTHALAEEWAREIEREMDRGPFLDPSEAERNTVADLIERYLREVTPFKRGAAPETSRLKAVQRRTIGQYKIAALSSAHIACYRDERLREVSSGTVNKELNLLRHVIETARREWRIALPDNPVSLVRRPVPPRLERGAGDLSAMRRRVFSLLVAMRGIHSCCRLCSSRLRRLCARAKSSAWSGSMSISISV